MEWRPESHSKKKCPKIKPPCPVAKAADDSGPRVFSGSPVNAIVPGVVGDADGSLGPSLVCGHDKVAFGSQVESADLRFAGKEEDGISVTGCFAGLPRHEVPVGTGAFKRPGVVLAKLAAHTVLGRALVNVVTSHLVLVQLVSWSRKT